VGAACKGIVGLIGWLWAACEAAADAVATAGSCVSPPEQLCARRALYIDF
jgi:hypothetical protein